MLIKKDGHCLIVSEKDFIKRYKNLGYEVYEVMEPAKKTASKTTEKAKAPSSKKPKES